MCDNNPFTSYRAGSYLSPGNIQFLNALTGHSNRVTPPKGANRNILKSAVVDDILGIDNFLGKCGFTGG